MSVRIDGDRYAAIAALFGDYAYAIDEGDGAEIAALFVADGELYGAIGGPPVVGREHISEFFTRRRAAGGPQRRHHIASMRIVARDGDDYRVSSYFISVGPNGQMSGTYHDVCRVTHEDGGWQARFVSKGVTVEVNGVTHGS